MDPKSLVARAERELAQPDVSLATLLEVFRAQPSARLAEVIERLSTVAEATRPPVPGKSAKERLDAAKRLIKAGDAVDLPRLYRVLPSLKQAEAMDLLAQLASLPPDPRVLVEVTKLLADPPWASSASHKFWRALLVVQQQQHDPRVAGAIGKVAVAEAFGGGWAGEAITEIVTRALAKMPPPPADDPALSAQLGRMIEKIGSTTSSGDELLARIYARPDDDALRAVYADWLVERGEPRGELISLQLGPSSEAVRKREAQLLGQHGAEWLGPLARVCESYRFERGFLSEARVHPGRALALAAERSWATLRTLWIWDRDAALPTALLRSPELRGLRVLGGVGHDHLVTLLDSDAPWPWSGLVVDIPNGREGFTSADRRLFERLDSPLLPSLSELGVDGYWPKVADCRWIFRTPIATKLRRFRSNSGLKSVPAWLNEELPDNIGALEVSYDYGWHGWTVELTRGDDGRFSHLSAILRSSRRDFSTSKVEDLVAQVLDEVPADAFETFALRVDGARVVGAEVKRVAQAASRQTRLSSLRLPGFGDEEAAALAQEARVKGPAKTVKATLADSAAAAKVASRAALTTAVAALPKAPDALQTLDVDQPTSLKKASDWIGKQKPSEGLTDVLFAIVMLEGATSELRRAALSRLVAGHLGERVVAALRHSHAVATDVMSGDDKFLDAADLSAVFDWFESLRGNKGVCRAHDVYYWIKAIAIQHGNADTLADLRTRLSDGRKLTSFHKWAYDEAVTRLGRKKKR